MSFWMDEYIINRRGLREDGWYGGWINNSKLPKINGKYVSSIWSPHDFINSEEEFDDVHFYDQWKFSNETGVLPNEIKHLFGWQEIGGAKQFVRHISFRTSCSGHASADEICTIYVKENHICVWNWPSKETKDKNKRTKLSDTKKSRYSIYYKDPYFQKVAKTLFEKEFISKWYNKSNPGIEDLKDLRTLHKACRYLHNTCAIRYINGKIYPDAHLDSWRWSSGFPFISNNWPQLDNIKVWYPPWDATLYLRKITEGEEDCIIVNFTKDVGFCKINRYNNGNPVKVDARKEKHFHSLYKIVSISQENTGYED